MEYAQKADLSVSILLREYHKRLNYLQSFLKKFRPDLSPPPKFTLQTIDGGKNPQDSNQAGLEAVCNNLILWI